MNYSKILGSLSDSVCTGTRISNLALLLKIKIEHGLPPHYMSIDTKSRYAKLLLTTMRILDNTVIDGRTANPLDQYPNRPSNRQPYWFQRRLTSYAIKKLEETTRRW